MMFLMCSSCANVKIRIDDIISGQHPCSIIWTDFHSHSETSSWPPSLVHPSKLAVKDTAWRMVWENDHHSTDDSPPYHLVDKSKAQCDIKIKALERNCKYTGLSPSSAMPCKSECIFSMGIFVLWRRRSRESFKTAEWLEAQINPEVEKESINRKWGISFQA